MDWSPSPIATLLIHAILVLAACAIVADGITDLYQEKIVQAGLPPQNILVPYLESTNAADLRRFVKLFARLLFYFYAVLAVLILFFEFGVIPQELTISIGSPSWKEEWDVEKIVFLFGTTFHVAIVVAVAWIVHCMATLRDDESRRRWRLGL